MFKRYFFLIFFQLLMAFDLQAKVCENLVNKFLTYHPTNDKSMMLTRFTNASDKHKFLRSFMPFYYTQVHKHAAKLPAFSKANKTTGLICGDAHVENFGYIVGNNAKPILSLNDLDDIAKGPLVLDVMRLSHSASYMLDQVNYDVLLKAYKKGLRDAPYTYSDFIVKLKSKSENGGDTPKADYVQTPTGTTFAKKFDPVIPTTKAQNDTFNTILKKKFGENVKLMDSYGTRKESGGSAFGKRFQLLAEINGKTQLVELKEIQPSGVVPQLRSTNLSDQERILAARDLFWGKNFDQKLDVVTVEGVQYQLRFKSEGNKSIDFGKVKAKDAQDVVQDEFYLLGQLHRKSLGEDPKKVDAYIKDLKSITIKEWQQTTDFMKKKIKTVFNLINN